MHFVFFFAYRPLPDMRRLSRDDFLCFNMMAPWRIEHATVPSLSWSEREREMRETRRRLSALSVYGAHFEQEF